MTGFICQVKNFTSCHLNIRTASIVDLSKSCILTTLHILDHVFLMNASVILLLHNISNSYNSYTYQNLILYGFCYVSFLFFPIKWIHIFKLLCICVCSCFSQFFLAEGLWTFHIVVLRWSWVSLPCSPMSWLCSVQWGTQALRPRIALWYLRVNRWVTAFHVLFCCHKHTHTDTQGGYESQDGRAQKEWGLISLCFVLECAFLKCSKLMNVIWRRFMQGH